MQVAELEVVIKGSNAGLTTILDESKNKVKDTAGKMSDDVEKSSKSMRESLLGAFKSVGQVATQTGLALSAAITAPLVKAGHDIVKTFGAFDEGLRNVDSLAKLTAGQFETLKKSVLSLADDPKIRQAPEDLANGLYDVYSSGFSGAKAMDILKISAYGASAGLTDTGTASRVLMAVLNSGIGGVNNAREAMDVLFKEVDLGVNTFGDLANQIGDVLPTAKLANVSLQEVAAGMAVLTRHGISAAESSTALNNLLLHIIKPAQGAQTAMDNAGISYGVAALQAKGLGGWIKDATDKLHGNKQKLTEILPEIRGLKALMVLADGSGKEFNDMLNQMGTATDGTGANMKALERQTAGMKFGWAEMVKQLKIAEIEFGDVLAPLLKDVTSTLRDVVQRFKDMDEPTKKIVLSVAALAAAVGPLLLAFGGIASAVTSLMTAFEAVGGVMAAAGGGSAVLAGALELLSGPIGWIIAGVTALAAAWYSNWGGIREFTSKIVSTIVGFFQENWPLIQEAAANVWRGIKETFAPLVPYIVTSWNFLVMATTTVWNNIKAGILQSLTNVLGIIKVFIQFLTGNWLQAWETVKEIMVSSLLTMEAQAARSAAAILRLIVGMFDGVSSVYHDMKGLLGMNGEGDKAAKFTGLDGMISSLDTAASGADMVAGKVRGLITGGGVKDFGKGKGNVDLGFGNSKNPKPINPFQDGDSGGDDDSGGTSKKSEAMKAIEEQAKELRKTIADLTKEIALNGDSTKSASMAYDIHTGIIKAQNKALGEKALALMKDAEAQEKARESAKAMKAIHDDLIKSTADQVKANQAATASTDIDRLSIEKFGKSYADLTDAKSKQEIVDAVSANRKKNDIELTKSANEWAKTTLANLKEEFVLRDKNTRVAKLEIQMNDEKYRNLSAAQKKALIESAKALDDADSHDRGAKSLEKLREFWEKVTAAVLKYQAEQRKAADERFAGSMLKLAERAANLGTETQATVYQTRLLAEQFGVGATQADKIADGMAKAKTYMAELFKIDQLQKFVDMIQKVADGFSKTITDSLGALVTGGFKPFFKTLIDGFRSTIADMAQEWLKSQIRSILMNLGRSMIGKIAGGKLSGGGGGSNIPDLGGDGTTPGFAVGGMVPKGDLFRMNEQGRDEMFVAPNGGMVIPASLSRELAKSGFGGGTTIIMNISTPDAGSFRESEDQIISRLAARIARTRNLS